MERDEERMRGNNNALAAGGESAFPQESPQWQAMLPGMTGLLELFSLIDTNGLTCLHFYEPFYLALWGPDPPWQTLLESLGALRLVTLKKNSLPYSSAKPPGIDCMCKFPPWCFLAKTCSCLHFWLYDEDACDGSLQWTVLAWTGFPQQSYQNQHGTVFQKALKPCSCLLMMQSAVVFCTDVRVLPSGRVWCHLDWFCSDRAGHSELFHPPIFRTAS